MNIETVSLQSVLLAALLGSVFAILHLTLLRISLHKLGTQRNSLRFLTAMSVLRIFIIVLLLWLVASQLQPLEFMVLIVSFIAARMILVQKFQPAFGSFKTDTGQ